MNYMIMIQAADPKDPVSIDAEEAYLALSDQSDCRMFYAEGSMDSVSSISVEELEKAVLDPDLCLIYYPSGYWKDGLDILNRSKCRLVFRCSGTKTSGINRPFFAERAIRAQTESKITELLQKSFPEAYWICTSRHLAGTINVPLDRTGICPLINQTEKWSRMLPDESILQMLADTKGVNVLFVGSFLQSGCHIKAIQAVQQYCSSYDRNITLRLVGRAGEKQKICIKYLKRFCEENDLKENVQFAVNPADAELLSWFAGSDLLLCYNDDAESYDSVMKAQYLELPVIAACKGAVPEMLGENQICLKDDARLMAAAIRQLTAKPELAGFLQRLGRDRYQRLFSSQVLRSSFIKEAGRR